MGQDRVAWMGKSPLFPGDENMFICGKIFHFCQKQSSKLDQLKTESCPEPNNGICGLARPLLQTNEQRSRHGRRKGEGQSAMDFEI